jgi:hypothetical protein
VTKDLLLIITSNIAENPKIKIRPNFEPQNRCYLILGVSSYILYIIFFPIFVFITFIQYFKQSCSDREMENFLFVGKSVLGKKISASRRHVTFSPVALSQLHVSET